MKKTSVLILVVVAAIVVIAGVFYARERDQEVTVTTVSPATELAPIALTAEEQKALESEGITPPSTGADTKTEDLEDVGTSDEIQDILSDINSTDLTGLDAETDAITNDLSGVEL